MRIEDILRHWPGVAKTRQTTITVNGKVIHSCDKMNCAHCNELEKASEPLFDKLMEVIGRLMK